MTPSALLYARTCCNHLAGELPVRIFNGLGPVLPLLWLVEIFPGYDTTETHTPEQIIRKLAESHKLIVSGLELIDGCRQLEIAESTWHRWLNQ